MNVIVAVYLVTAPVGERCYQAQCLVTGPCTRHCEKYSLSATSPDKRSVGRPAPVNENRGWISYWYHQARRYCRNSPDPAPAKMAGLATIVKIAIMKESVKKLNLYPLSRKCRIQLQKMGEFPLPDRLHALQLLEIAQDNDRVREDLRPEVLFQLRIAPKNPSAVADLLGMRENQIQNIGKGVNPKLHLLEIVEAVAKEDDLPQYFL
jgi:hypothetical protein